MSKEYEEYAKEWIEKLNEAKTHIAKATELIGEVPPMLLTAISIWGEKGILTKEGKEVSLDIVSHSGDRGKLLCIYGMLQAILNELNSSYY